MIEDKKYTVYRHTTPSGKVYIGITKQNPEKRWENGNGYKGNEHFYRAILKYGWENIKHEIICQASLSSVQAGAVEKSFIALYDSTNPDKGYNHSIGEECGMLGVHHSIETRRKLSESNKRTYLNPELRRKSSEAKKKAVICVETGTLYSSGAEAAESIGVTNGAISMAVSGKRKTAGGYHWKYAEAQSLERQSHDKL